MSASPMRSKQMGQSGRSSRVEARESSSAFFSLIILGGGLSARREAPRVANMVLSSLCSYSMEEDDDDDDDDCWWLIELLLLLLFGSAAAAAATGMNVGVAQCEAPDPRGTSSWACLWKRRRFRWRSGEQGEGLLCMLRKHGMGVVTTVNALFFRKFCTRLGGCCRVGKDALTKFVGLAYLEGQFRHAPSAFAKFKRFYTVRLKRR